MREATSTTGGSTASWLAGRLVQIVAIVFLVTTLSFVLVHAAPGDPFSTSIDNPSITEAMRAKWRAAYGLDQPLGTQYVAYVKNVARGEMGWSFSMHRPVIDVLLDALPNTLLLTITALALGFIVGITLGALQAYYAGSWWDRSTSAVSMFFYAMPDFWLAIMLLLGFGYWIKVFPIGGAIDPVMHDYLGFGGRIMDRVHHLVLPAITLALLSAAGIARYQRAELLRVLPEDFVRTARAKGVRERTVILRHALRNAALPVISLLGVTFPLAFTGAVFVERVFAWPGMGWTIVNAVSTRDYPLVLASVILASATVSIGSLLADLMYRFVDPRAGLR